VNAAPATPARVNSGGMARRPTGRKRQVRGEERQRSNERSAGQNRDGQAGVTSTKRGFAALELRLHDILLQSLQRAILKRCEKG
jgi:hypothetical protein